MPGSRSWPLRSEKSLDTSVAQGTGGKWTGPSAAMRVRKKRVWLWCMLLARSGARRSPYASRDSCPKSFSAPESRPSMVVPEQSMKTGAETRISRPLRASRASTETMVAAEVTAVGRAHGQLELRVEDPPAEVVECLGFHEDSCGGEACHDYPEFSVTEFAACVRVGRA